MSPVSEQCSCGARIDLIPGMALPQAFKFVEAWRSNHKHEMQAARGGAGNIMGFALPQPQFDDD